MITKRKGHVCCVCWRKATRTARDEFGTLLRLCRDCPTPAEIRERAAAVRAGWDEREHYSRHYDCGRPQAYDAVAVATPVVTPAPMGTLTRLDDGEADQPV